MNTQERAAVTEALCRAVGSRLPACLESLFDTAIRILQEQRLLAYSNREAQACDEFIRFCATQKPQVIAQTVATIRSFLPAGILQKVAEPSSATEWSLVDDAEVDEMLESRRLARHLRKTLGPQEWRCCARLNTLTRTQARGADNPLSLEFLVRTLQTHLHLRQQSAIVRERFYEAAAEALGATLPDYLQRLDDLFEQFQVEPSIEPTEQPNRPYRSSASNTASDAPYRAIQRLRNHTAPPAADVPDVLRLRQAFSRLQQTPAPSQGRSAQGFLRELDAAGAALSPRQREDAGLVAELFQQIDLEPLIASNVKPALRRLMVPIVRATMFEPEAFADPSHPVRATLDKMMRLCDRSEPPNAALESRMEQLIDGIVRDYQGDSEVFTRCNEELERLLAAQQRAYSNNANRVLQYHRGHDTLVQARAQIDRELAALFGNQAPKVLLDWLNIGWHELLVHELIRHGEQSTELLDDLGVIRQLNDWLHQELAGDCDQRVERHYQIGPLLELLRRRMAGYLPGQYRHTPILEVLEKQLLGEQAVELVQLPPPPPPLQQAELEPSRKRWRERVRQLNSGDWLVTQSGQHLQLIWANPTTDHYVLVDQQGHEAGSFTCEGLMDQLAIGWISTPGPEAQGVIQKHLQDVIGKLYRDIAHVRSHDELTGLPNRRSFETTVAQTLASTEQHAFLYGHIDQFGLLNSSCGHLAGDSYLKGIATLLRQQLPENAALARVGGAEFAIALPSADAEQALSLAERLRAAVEAAPFEWQGHRHSPTMSLGVVQGHARHDVVNVFCDLQAACNAAKEAGRNRVHLYRDEQDGARTGLMAIAARVDDIIEHDGLSLRMQQIAPTRTNDGQLPHYEVLLVMQNDLNLLDFITAAERYNRMSKVDRWVLKRVFSELSLHPEFWAHASGVSINLSGNSLNDDKLLEFIEALFEQHGVPAEKICFELTETAAVANLTKTADLVRYLQRFGCTFSIDDFGTGFSSYEYLKRLPVNYVKIDGSFVKEIENSPSDLAMVKSINEIAHVLGRRTIAEYVETNSIRQRLAELDIDFVQGHGVQMPRSMQECLAG